MKKIAPVLFVVIALAACTSAKHNITRLEPLDEDIIYTNGHALVTAEDSDLRLTLHSEVSPGGVAVFTIDAENMGAQSIEVAFSDFMIDADYYQTKFYRELDEVTDLHPVDPYKTADSYANIISSKDMALKKKKDRESVSGLIHATGSLIDTLAARNEDEQSKIDEKNEKYSQRELKNQVDNIEEAGEIRDLTAAAEEFRNTALFRETLKPGMSVKGKKIYFSLPEYITNIRLIYKAEGKAMAFPFAETRAQ